jgi:hypothetical protein
MNKLFLLMWARDEFNLMTSSLKHRNTLHRIWPEKEVNILLIRVKKVVPMPKHHTTKIYRGVKLKLHALLTSALDGDEWSYLCSDYFTPRKGVPGIH